MRLAAHGHRVGDEELWEKRVGNWNEIGEGRKLKSARMRMHKRASYIERNLEALNDECPDRWKLLLT